MSDQYDDPFKTFEKHPSVSWKDKPVGTRLVAKVIEAPQLVHARDYETNERDYWDEAKTQPKMTVVTTVETPSGDVLSLWAPKPSALFAAIGDAQQRAGARIAPGGTLTVEYTGDKPNEKNPRLNPAKQFRVEYTPPSAFDSPAQQQPPAQQPMQSAMVDAEPPF